MSSVMSRTLLTNPKYAELHTVKESIYGIHIHTRAQRPLLIHQSFYSKLPATGWMLVHDHGMDRMMMKGAGGHGLTK